MSITLTGTGGLFTRLGQVEAAVNSINTYRGTTFPGLSSGIAAQYASNPEMIPNLENNTLGNQSQFAGFLTQLQGIAQTTVINMVANDNPQPDQSIGTALGEVIRQMNVGSASIGQNTVSCSVGGLAGITNDGNGQVVYSLKDVHGNALQMILAEDVIISCIQDAQAGGTVGAESFEIQGEYLVGDPFNWAWPGGSGATQTLTAVPAGNATNGNLLTNSDFQTFTVANIPDGWTIVSGAAGTEILQTATAYSGSSALSLVGTGTNPSIVLPLTNLQPETQYALCFWTRVSASATGTLTVRLYDYGNSVVVNDDTGTANSLAINLTGLTTSYVAHTAAFRIPREIPTSLRLEINGTTIQSGKDVYIDRMTLAPMTQLYSGGPSFSIASGSSQFIQGDTFIATVANNYGCLFATLLERLFGLNAQQLVVPNAGSPTISDSLI